MVWDLPCAKTETAKAQDTKIDRTCLVRTIMFLDKKDRGGKGWVRWSSDVLEGIDTANTMQTPVYPSINLDSHNCRLVSTDPNKIRADRKTGKRPSCPAISCACCLFPVRRPASQTLGNFPLVIRCWWFSRYSLGFLVPRQALDCHPSTQSIHY